MASVIKQCKVCGKDYKYCNTLIPGVFRWQDVACCREHAQIWFERIEESRKANRNEAVKPPMMTTVFEERSIHHKTVDCNAKKADECVDGAFHDGIAPAFDAIDNSAEPKATTRRKKSTSVYDSDDE